MYVCIYFMGVVYKQLQRRPHINKYNYNNKKIALANGWV